MSDARGDTAILPDVVQAIALDGCHIKRYLDNAVEVVHATPADRSFPDRVNESLGVCLKTGPAHDVRADGRTLRYPEDAICVRTPGTVWSTRATGQAGFLSIDIEPTLLPPGGLIGAMRFVERPALRGLSRCIRVLRSDASTLNKQVVVTELIDALLGAGLVTAPFLDAGLDARAADRARELLTSRIADPPTLQELADAVGSNRFVLLREFRRRVGVPPPCVRPPAARRTRAGVALARRRHLMDVARARLRRPEPPEPCLQARGWSVARRLPAGHARLRPSVNLVQDLTRPAA
ncbi:MAG: hypothetical protein WKG32_12850 [Gemmatimonadaceae bacterium]